MFTDNNIYTINRIKYLILTNCNLAVVLGKENSKTNVGDLIIPDGIEISEGSETKYYKVIGINENAFRYDNLLSIDLSENIKYISNYAFYGCKNLKYINFKNKLLVIGNNAFSNCTKLTISKLPDSLAYIGENAFSNNTNIYEIITGKNLRCIDKRAFSGCTNLIYLNINNSQYIQIKEGAFINCKSLCIFQNKPTQQNLSTIDHQQFKDIFNNTPLYFNNITRTQ